MELISLILNLVLSGGLIVTLVTLRSTKQKASAEAKGSELDNIQDAISIWREMATNLRQELSQSKDDYKSVSIQLENLRKEVAKLTRINGQMVKLLDKITPENLETMIQQIKSIHENNG